MGGYWRSVLTEEGELLLIRNIEEMAAFDLRS
jgi:hypothetical protein